MAMYHMSVQSPYGTGLPQQINNGLHNGPVHVETHNHPFHQNISNVNYENGMSDVRQPYLFDSIGHRKTQYTHPHSYNFHQKMPYDKNLDHHSNCVRYSHDGLPISSKSNSYSLAGRSINDYHNDHFHENNVHNHVGHFGSNQRKQFSVDEELLQKMTTLHLGYLETEDSPHKMEQREKLEDVITEYLSVTPHSRKFMIHQVRDVLEKSILTRPDFNIVGAACAFDALAQYAANLVSQPWRKEFKEIKLHNGFWVHQVANHLSGAETILEFMGYIRKPSSADLLSRSSENIFQPSLQNVSYQYVLHGLIDPDMISRLALECIIAYCECQCLRRIKEGIVDYSLAWSQVLQFRQVYIGGVEVSVKHLSFTLRQNSAPTNTRFSESEMASNYPASSKPSHPYHTNAPSQSKATTPTSIERFHTPDSTLDCKMHLQCTGDSGQHDHNNRHSRASNTSGFSSFCSTKENYSKNRLPEDRVDSARRSTTEFLARVPTAKLIDVDSSNDGHTNHHSALPKVLPNQHKSSGSNSLRKSSRSSISNDNYERNNHFNDSLTLRSPPDAFKEGTLDEHLEVTMNLVKNTTKASNNLHSGKGLTSCNVDGWDFVYKNLEKKGYSKDIGDRGDILQGPNLCKKSDGYAFSGNGSQCHLGHIYQKDIDRSRPLSINQALHQLDLQCTKERIDNPPISPPNNSLPSFHSMSLPYSHENRQRSSFYDNLENSDFETANGVSEGSDGRNSSSSLLKKKVNNTFKSEPLSKPANFTGSKQDPLAKNTNLLRTKLDLPTKSNASTNSSNYRMSAGKIEDFSPTLASHDNKNSREMSSMEGNDTWSCNTCTFENSLDTSICEMCGKSRVPGAESRPLESGGRQCPLCTLINDKNAEHCSACNVDLKGSSTYI